MAKMTGWQKGCLVTALGCASLIVLAVTATGIALVWAASSARRLGDLTPEPVSRTIERVDRSARGDGRRGGGRGDGRRVEAAPRRPVSWWSRRGHVARADG